ncbi:MAG TPA: sigma 54-interacting transcriptional regulator [Candidatus Dependentiae bacterium]|nr:sigma 54-interacting transcriptional regulator [Candidatus Dependentiae bacterium]
MIPEDIAWILRTIHFSIIPSIDYRIVRAVIRFAWAFEPIRFHAFGLFLEQAACQKYVISLRQKILIFITGSLGLFFILIMIFNFNCAYHKITLIPEIIAIRFTVFYSSLIITPICLAHTIRSMRKNNLPRILKKQIIILIQALAIPNALINLLQNFPFKICFITIVKAAESYTMVGLATILLTYMIYYCAKKMVGLRFLNISSHVKSTWNFSFINNFKDVLEQLGQATTIQELTFATQEIFQKAFQISPRSVTLHSYTYQGNKISCQKNLTGSTIDTVLNATDSQLTREIQQSKILIYDEIAFTNFYEQDESSTALVSFLDKIYADIFIPIFNHNKIVGCIIIERNARPKNLYGSAERDEMIVFASYLGNIINLLQNRNLDNILASEKEMREELFSKHQEINQYKESMRSFLHNSKHEHIGIIFYKNRQFVFGNQEAQEMVQINLNVHIGHPLAKACRQIIADVERFKSTQHVLTFDAHGNNIVIKGMAYLERTHVILVVYYPEATDLIHKQIDQLKDPSEWDYLLYLETTKTGALINQLIPGTTPHILNFKIELLKASLSSKATFIDMPSEDLMPTVELLHHISIRTNLETVTLTQPQATPDLTIKLFGINPLFGAQGQEPLLKKLDATGTLFIQNIHFLNRETQDYLAECIHYGFFRLYKSDQKIFCNTRIICSSTQSLDQLVHDNKMSLDLYKELQKTKLVFPSLSLMAEEEIDELIEGLAQQAMADKTFHKILEFDTRDKKRILQSRPASLQELKKRIQNSLIQKSRAHNIDVEKTFDPAYPVSDPDLIEIARLGKHALKDEKAMTILWNKFKNQNKIAVFLGVNRSSVNRRCKDYNLI